MDQNTVAKTPEIQAVIVARFQALKEKGFGPYGPEVRIRWWIVLFFTWLTRDRNRIHKFGRNAFFDWPIAPGLLELAFLPRLMPDWQEAFPVPGHGMMLEDMSIRFARPVKIGAAIRMRRCAEEIKVDRLGLRASFKLEITGVGETRPSVWGVMQVRFMQPKRNN